jgi:hypothetical protein
LRPRSIRKVVVEEIGAGCSCGYRQA